MQSRPNWGPGRIDPFNPVKFYNLGLADDGTIGNSDIMPLWDLAALTPQSHYGLHWDGLSTSLEETALAGAIGDGLTPNAYVGAKDDLAQVIEFARLQRAAALALLSELPEGRDPYQVDRRGGRSGQGALSHKLRAVPREDGCALSRGYFGGRDRNRSPPHRHVDRRGGAERYMNYEPGYNWGFKAFQKVNGYLATELTGLWLKAPYLHNGSVPTLRDLLKRSGRRDPGRSIAATI